MKLYDENYGDTAAEFQELWQFLIDCYALSGRPDNWLFDRLEDWKYGGNAQRARQWPSFFQDHAHLWRGPAGELLGFCIGEYDDDSVFLQPHPHQRWVEDAMLAWAEATWGGGRASIATYTCAGDTPREQLLARRGYADAGESGRTYCYDLARPYAVGALPPGFRFATLADDRNIDSHIAAVRAAFGRDTLDRAWFDTKITAPTYALEWDLALISPEGEHVAFCLARLDQRNLVAPIDPIGTRPDHQRRGLGKALVAECLRRLRAAGMRYAYIGAGPEPAVGNRLYESLGPAATYVEHRWAKRIA